jgi:hypothetical protein
VTLVELTPDRAFIDVPVTTFAAEGVPDDDGGAED